MLAPTGHIGRYSAFNQPHSCLTVPRPTWHISLSGVSGQRSHVQRTMNLFRGFKAPSKCVDTPLPIDTPRLPLCPALVA